MAVFTVRSAAPNIDLRRVHLARNIASQPEDILLNVLPETFPQTFIVGDEWRVEFTLVRRIGSNGR